jgi:type II secretory pathway predicted ATPase ExeA
MNLEQHFGLTSLPFRRDPSGEHFYESNGHQEALARLQFVIREKSFGLLSGEVGAGKSTIIRRLVESLDTLRHLPLYICRSGLKPKDFYGDVLRQLGETPPHSLAKARYVWEEHLANLRERANLQWVILIDEAQDMSEEMIQELRYIRNQEMDGCSLFSLILAGQPEIRSKMRGKRNQAILQRIAWSFHLDGFTKEETAAYIKHQMKVGGSNIPVFSESAMLCIHGASQGIPRIINHVCLQALYDATHRGIEVIEESQIQRILADQERQRGTAG